MEQMENRVLDAERALYGSHGLAVRRCTFDGPADGESALKECSDILAEDCRFCLRYPMWHDRTLTVRRCELTQGCRAALWYSRNVTVEDSRLDGIKALRECDGVTIRRCAIRSPEFGWSVRGIRMEDSTAEGEYFMMRSTGLRFDHVTLRGKYSFQYVEDGVFDHCDFDTKDAFWHARNVTVKNSVVRGEYLAWYCENVTFDHCRIIGTQPLCYCRGLTLIDCEMMDTDLAFERSQVQATVTTPILSIKNPLSGSITAPAVGEIIRDIPGAEAAVTVTGQN